MISKELLSEVLKEEIIRFGSFNEPILEIEVQRYSYREWLDINIHELAHRCKEWAFDNNQEISAYRMRGFLKPTYRCSVMLKDKNERDIRWKNLSYYNSEPEAIFKACEWILKQKEKHE